MTGRERRVWTLRILLATVFVAQGAGKFGPSRLWDRVFAEIGLGHWFRAFTGALELLAGALLLVPRRNITRPAVALLLITMLGALAVHLFIIGVGPQTVFVALLMLALVDIWRHTDA